MRIFLTIALLTAALVAVPAARADACSCALLSASEMLADHEAAFVGTLIERSDTVQADANFGPTVTFTFEVEQWLKGDLGDTIEVQSASDGAACGFEIPVGERAAIFLYRQGTGWGSGLCSTLPADVALAAMVPLVTGSSDPPFAVLYGGSGPQRLLLIDAQGDVISLLPDDDGSWLNSISVCPGGHRLIEAGEVIRVRSIPSLEVEREYAPEGDYLTKAWCRSEDAAEVLSLVTISRPDSELTRLVDQDGRAFFEGRAWVAEVIGDTAFVAANEGKTLVAIDVLTGESKVAYDAQVASDGYGGIEAIAADGRYLAFVSTAYSQDQVHSELVVIDGVSGDVVAQTEVAEAASARWIGPGKLAVATHDEIGLHHMYDATTLEKVGSVVPTFGTSVVAGDLGVGLDQGTLLAYQGDEVRQMRTYPNATLWNVAIIDPTINPDVPLDAPLVEPPPMVEPTVPTEVSSPPVAAPSPRDGTSAPGWPWLLGGAGLLVAGAVALRRRFVA